ncbi:hypothetical protein THAOC_03074 [Thalassiosira oceanica]|uniref:Uncharacterized protein n=1 Tax=Thalassiosira oceanica TaxID=159749 RepID=K0TCU1_THAOC|nr:hypothetical protein THAOC_03074 [Thalassiosira oceanica]|eukprot:EJK75210.1 hypothetical protein THAOC_03074 [Thalassiosira oceanica]
MLTKRQFKYAPGPPREGGPNAESGVQMSVRAVIYAYARSVRAHQPLRVTHRNYCSEREWRTEAYSVAFFSIPAAPRVHRGPSTPPSDPISVLGSSAAHTGGTSVSWPPVRVRICRSDNAAAGMASSISLLTFVDVANRRLTEARGCGATHLTLGTPWFSSFFLFFVCTLVTVEAWARMCDLA